MPMLVGFLSGLLVSFFTAGFDGPPWAVVGLFLMTWIVVGLIVIVAEEVEKLTK